MYVNKFLTVRRPNRLHDEGLYQGFVIVNVTDWQNKLIGFGCDGASINIGGRRLKGYLEKSVPWIVSFGGLAHRPELVMKDTLKVPCF